MARKINEVKTDIEKAFGSIENVIYDISRYVDAIEEIHNQEVDDLNESIKYRDQEIENLKEKIVSQGNE